MSRILKIAHISDVHLTPVTGFSVGLWNVKRGLGYLNWLRSRRHGHSREAAVRLVADAWGEGADHIAVTGDLVHLGLPSELDSARLWLEEIGPPDRVSLVPGNHDIYTALMRGASCVERWGSYMASCVEGVRDAPQTEDVFPYVRRIGPAAIIGINSALPRPPFVASGRIGEGQRARLAHVLERLGAAGLARVVLIHHPPLPGQAPRLKALEDAGDLADVIARHGAELVLHGHNHLDMLAYAPTASGKDRVPVVGVASGSATTSDDGLATARYKLLIIDAREDTRKIEMVTRGIDPDSGEIREIARQMI